MKETKQSITTLKNKKKHNKKTTLKQKLSLLFMLLAFLAMAQPHVTTAPESRFDFVETNHDVVDIAQVFVKKLPLGIKRKIIEGELILKINSTKIVEISKDGLFYDIKWLEENIADRANIKTLAAFQDVTYLDNGVEKTGDLRIVQKGDDVGVRYNNAIGNLSSWISDFYKIPRAKQSLKKVIDAGLIKIVPNLTIDEIASLHRYTVNNFELTIAAYGNGYNSIQQSWVNLIKLGLNKLRKANGSYVGKVFRGTNLTPENLKPYIEAWKSTSKLKVEPPFLSTSTSEKIANDFINKFRQEGKIEVMFEINSKSGVYVDEISAYGKNLCAKNPNCTTPQFEVILRNNSRFHVDNLEKITKSDGAVRYIIEMSEL